MGIIFIVLLLVLFYILISHGRGSGQGCLMGGHSQGSDATETPLEVLRRRYARGEIGRDEFEERRRDLT